MEKINVVIPFLKNFTISEQLKYSIRSVCSYYDVDRVVLVGGKPDWYIGEHIDHEDYNGSGQKEKNIRDKTAAGARLINGDFLYTNDDFILFAPIRTTFNKGLCSEVFNKHRTNGRRTDGSYARLIKNTWNKYGDIPFTDCHCPMWMNTKGVEKTLFEWELFGYGFKTCYCQENNIESIYMEDSKISEFKDFNNIREWISLKDDFNTKLLGAYFQNKTKFEK